MTVNHAFISERRRGGGGMRARRPARRRLPAGLRDEVNEVFRRTILDAAERVFGARGFAEANVKMTEIAEGAGVAAGTLYNYFESKEAIFNALLEQCGDEFAARLAPIAKGPGRAREKLVLLARTTFDYVESHGAMLTLLLQTGGAASSEGNRHCRRTLAVFESTVALAARQGVVRRGLDHREVAAAFAGSMGGMVRRWLLTGRRGRLADRADFVVDLLLTGAGPRP